MWASFGSVARPDAGSRWLLQWNQLPGPEIEDELLLITRVGDPACQGGTFASDDPPDVVLAFGCHVVLHGDPGDVDGGRSGGAAASRTSASRSCPLRLSASVYRSITRPSFTAKSISV